LSRFSDHLLFVSAHERDTFFQKIGKPAIATTMVHNGLNPAEFEPVAPAPDAADLIYVGMMRDLKGPDLFIDAVAAASGRLQRPISAVMVGDGDDLPRYRQQAARLDLDIRFHPPMPAREAFALGRVVVVPSRAEAMP